MPQPEGYLFVDHRASPGLPEDFARKVGYEPSQVAEGKLWETATLTCAHCCTVNIKNPDRTRERYSCMQCSGRYICDNCNLERLKPDYNHLPIAKIVDLVGSGEATAVRLGVQPLLIPTKGKEV